MYGVVNELLSPSASSGGDGSKVDFVRAKSFRLWNYHFAEAHPCPHLRHGLVVG